MMTCPCDLARPYADCCGRWHAGPQAGQAPDAAALMRSRYSAYVRGLDDYLLATWHPSTRPASLADERRALRWLGLELRRHAVQDEAHQTVEFVARWRGPDGRAGRQHETSRFVKLDGRWFYVDGDLRG